MVLTDYSSPKKIELLAPAKNIAVAIEAIKHGADAVYIGAPSHGARHAASNSINDIAELCRFAHPFGVKVYVTINTIIYETELADVKQLINELYHIGVDALIVQDMAILRMDIPPIELHASTQCDIRTPQKAEFLSKCGFSQIVLPRELTLDETRHISKLLPQTTLEAFVHGALCVSYSGDCQAGWVMSKRSANRGECPQVCRLPFNLIDGTGKVILQQKHLLSLRDLNRSNDLINMLNAGISSFKIEGRLKDTAYVKNITASYSRLLDDIIKQNPDKWQRASFGSNAISFAPSLSESFNRGFTSYFTSSTHPNGKMANFNTPKWVGQPIAKVLKSDGKNIWITDLKTEITNGDGLGFFDKAAKLQGFRVNNIKGNKIALLSPLSVPAGTQLYRNFNNKFNRVLESDTATRTIEVNFCLRLSPHGLVLDAEAQNGCRASVAEFGKFEQAKTPQRQRHDDLLRKTGQTIFSINSVSDLAANIFIPASILTHLRRRALQALMRQWNVRRPIKYRQLEDQSAPLPSKTLTRHENIANSLAKKFYSDHGAEKISPAAECSQHLAENETVMTTRYCLRREMGACLRNKDGVKLTPPLLIQNGSTYFKLEFDCKECRMLVKTTAKNLKSHLT